MMILNTSKKWAIFMFFIMKLIILTLSSTISKDKNDVHLQNIVNPTITHRNESSGYRGKYKAPTLFV